MSHILVTGGTGFIGQSLIKVLQKEDVQIRATYHGNKPVTENGQDASVEWTRYDLEHDNDYSKLLADIDIIIHLAGKAHIHKQNGHAGNSFVKINSEGTRQLAEAAARAGVRRFLYLSTVKVHGDVTTKNSEGGYQRFTENDRLNPQDPYATSKLDAEHQLRKICQSSKMDYVILRPPLIYGPGVKANFLRLIDTVAKGIPLPFASIHNLRSLLYVENLGDAILACSRRPEASNQVYLLSDIDISLTHLIHKIALFLGTKTLLFPCHGSLLKLAGVLTGKQEIMTRLMESLVIDNSKLARELGWKPPVSFDEGLGRTIDWYRKYHGK
ncbi:MAG: NAD-dependent epimerase/dehydratase family protein [Gammaproteobacteria bacterium]